MPGADVVDTSTPADRQRFVSSIEQGVAPAAVDQLAHCTLRLPEMASQLLGMHHHATFADAVVHIRRRQAMGRHCY